MLYSGFFMRKRLCFPLAFALFFAALPFYASACVSKAENAVYEISCELDGETLSGVERVTFYNFTDNVFTALKFNLFANAFRQGAKYSPVSPQYEFQAYKWGKSYGKTEITGVMADGKPADFSVGGEDMNILTVPLAAELFPNETVTAEISFSVDLAKVIARTGINDRTVNLANFYPILCGIEDGAFYECAYYFNGDPFFSDPADYSVEFTCAENITVAASGEEKARSAFNGKITRKYSIENARSFAIVASEEFTVLSEKTEDAEILYYYYADETPADSVAAAKKALRLYSEEFGRYPFRTFSVVQTPFIAGGMEFSALAYIGDDLEPTAYREVIVHETAHQWWQTAVGNNEIKHPFIDEGLAEYSVVLFYERYPEYGYTRESLIRSFEQTYKIFCTVYDKVVGNVDTSMLRSLPEYTSEYEYVNIAYVKACIMFDYLRQTVGEEKFFSGLKLFYRENAFKTATPESLVGAFERAGANSNGFFESFFSGTVII